MSLLTNIAVHVSLGMYGEDEIQEITKQPVPALDEDPSIPFGDNYTEPGPDMGQTVEAEIIEELEEMT